VTAVATTRGQDIPAGPARTFLAAMRPVLPVREARALAVWAQTFFPWQLDLLLDFGGASILTKSRRIGGSYTAAAKAAVWTLFGEESFLVSVGEREAGELLRQTEHHLTVLAALGSAWARPARRKYTNDLVLRVASGGVCVALPASSAARGWGGNVLLDEFAYHANADRVWDAAAAATLHGGAKLRVLSTPNGPSGLFFELATSTADDGFRRYSITLTQARAQGLKVSDRLLAVDEEVALLARRQDDAPPLERQRPQEFEEPAPRVRHVAFFFSAALAPFLRAGMTGGGGRCAEAGCVRAPASTAATTGRAGGVAGAGGRATAGAARGAGGTGGAFCATAAGGAARRGAAGDVATVAGACFGAEACA